jgi:hypothetical protein
MSLTEALVRSLCDTLWTTMTRSSAEQDYRFAQWLQMPLPRNDYWDLVRGNRQAGDTNRIVPRSLVKRATSGSA